MGYYDMWDYWRDSGADMDGPHQRERCANCDAQLASDPSFTTEDIYVIWEETEHGPVPHKVYKDNPKAEFYESGSAFWVCPKCEHEHNYTDMFL